MRNLTLLLNCRSGALGGRGGVGWQGGDVTRVTTVEKAELGLWPPGCPRGSGGGQRSEQPCPLCTPTSFTRAVLELRRPPVSGLLKAVGIGSGGKHLHFFYGNLWPLMEISTLLEHIHSNKVEFRLLVSSSVQLKPCNADSARSDHTQVGLRQECFFCCCFLASRF